MTTDDEPSTLSAAEIDAAILTDEDLRQRSQKLDEAQERWENLVYLSTEKIPCPECGGSGRVGSGSFGDTCVACMGSRVQESPDSDGPGFEIPPFAQLRAQITEYGNALADRELPAGHLGKRNLALPAASTVPTLEAITQLDTDARAKTRALKQLTAAAEHGRGVDPRQLPEGRIDRNISDEADLGDIDDAELDDMEENATNPNPRGRK